MSMYRRLTDRQKPVELIIFPDEGHIKRHPVHRYSIYARNVDWFNFWLRGVEDLDPIKAEQYTRWRRLRAMHDSTEAKTVSGAP